MTALANVPVSRVSAAEDAAELDPASIDVANAAAALGLDDVFEQLRAPDSGNPLVRSDDGSTLSDGRHRYPLVDGLPVLFPERLQPYLDREAGMLRVPFERYDDALLQYFLISGVKQTHGDANSPHDSPWYRRHVHRARSLLTDARGLVLDIGADDPEISRKLLPRDCRYLGLEPLFSDRERFRLIGVAEFLPLADASVDAACFLTSLDHVLDHHRAIDEARRVLRPGGRLYLASLVWERGADLHHDHQHFHHFRLYELLGALDGFKIDRAHRYGWKGDEHRYGLYLAATKPA